MAHTSSAGVEIKGDEAMIQTLADFSKRNASYVKGILNLTIPLSESPVWILGQFLWQLGLSTESRRPMEDGQRVRYYRLNTEPSRYWSIAKSNGSTGKENVKMKKNEMRLMQLGCNLSMELMLRPYPPIMKVEIIIGEVWT
ncbi:MAG: hypothetical protein ACYTXI_40165 [Nostoc sp.]